MKKMISVLMVVVAMAMVLTACGKFTCDLCRKEKSGKKHETEILGQEIEICDDCYTTIDEGVSSLKDALEF